MIYFVKQSIYVFTLGLRKTTYMFYSIVKIVLLTKPKYKFPLTDRDDIIVIGNAPSFLEDLNAYPGFFKGKDLMCVNNFPSSDLYETLKPNYIFIIDTAYYSWGKDMMPVVEKTLNCIVEKTSWEVTMFVPQLGRKASSIKMLTAKNPLVKIQHYNYTVVDGFDWFSHRIFRANLGMPLCKNVIVAAIFGAINMRYKNVYLTGVDNAFFKEIVVGKDNVLYTNASYFYSKDKVKGTFYNNIEKGEKMAMPDFFKWCYNTFTGYKKLSVYSRFMNVKVINTTEHSFIDAFEKKNVSELL